MNIELFLKNGIFLSLFLSMISFWTQNVESNPVAQNKVEEGRSSAGEAQVPSAPKFVKFEFGASRLLNPIVFQEQIGSKQNLSENLFALSFFFITFELLYRWFLSGHPPLSNLYESLLFLLWGLLGFFLFIYSDEKNISLERNSNGKKFESKKLTASKISMSQISSANLNSPRFNDNSNVLSTRNFLGCILSSTALFIQTFADWRLPDEMREIKPLIPALQSNWLLMHVSIMILSYAALLIGCIVAITYIVIERGSVSIRQENSVKNEKEQNNRDLEQNSPFFLENTFIKSGIGKSFAESENQIFLDSLDSLSYRILAFGFPLLTLGILSGAVWANEAWGSYWSWDPKETWAFITWLIFAFYLHTRLQYGWEGKKSAYVATFGFFIVWVCYLGVNLLGKGLHSYGWLTS